MSTYTVVPSSVAALISVTAPDGTVFDCIYMADKKPIEIYRPPNMGKALPEDTLPLAVRAAVSRDFGIVFALPIEKREAHVRNCMPYSVEVQS